MGKYPALFVPVAYKYVAMHASNMFNRYLQKVSHADIMSTTTTGRSSMVYASYDAQHVCNAVCYSVGFRLTLKT